MPLTRDAFQSYLVAKLGGKLAFVGKSITLTTGVVNPDLAFPMATAVATLGGAVEDFAAVTDDEIAAVPSIRTPALQGLAMLYTLQDIWGCMTDVTESVESRSESWSAMSREIIDMINVLEKRYATILVAYGKVSGGKLTVRTASRGFGRGGYGYGSGYSGLYGHGSGYGDGEYGPDC